MWAGRMGCKETQADPHSLFGLRMSLDTSYQWGISLCRTQMNRRPVFKSDAVTNKVILGKSQEQHESVSLSIK